MSRSPVGERVCVVHFDETGEEREVVSYCRRCAQGPEGGEEIEIVSPSGVAHCTANYNDRTKCGIDATGDDWWHRL